VLAPTPAGADGPDELVDVQDGGTHVGEGALEWLGHDPILPLPVIGEFSSGPTALPLMIVKAYWSR
jgi:hypothetical protein